MPPARLITSTPRRLAAAAMSCAQMVLGTLGVAPVMAGTRCGAGVLPSGMHAVSVGRPALR